MTSERKAGGLNIASISQFPTNPFQLSNHQRLIHHVEASHFI